MGQGRVFRRGRVWWIQYNVAGRQYRESAKTSRKDAAQALLSKRLSSIWEGRFFPDVRSRADLTIGGLRDMWLQERKSKRSIADDKQRLGVAVEHFGEHRLVSTLTSDDVSAWRDVLEDGHETATVNRYLAALRGALNLATEKGHAHRNPMLGVRLEDENNRRNRVCSAEEYATLRDAATIELRALVIMGYWTGMRLGEITGLEWGQIDLQAREIRLSGADTKEGDRKTVPLPTEAIADLATIPRQISGRLFSHDVRYYSATFAALADDCKIRDLRFHDLRHTAVTNMRRAGVDLVTIQQITGHKTLAMLQRYNVVTADDLKAAMARSENHAAGLDFSKR